MALPGTILSSTSLEAYQIAGPVYNGSDLYVFYVNGTTLSADKSTDGGQNWSNVDTFTIASTEQSLGVVKTSSANVRVVVSYTSSGSGLVRWLDFSLSTETFGSATNIVSGATKGDLQSFWGPVFVDLQGSDVLALHSVTSQQIKGTRYSRVSVTRIGGSTIAVDDGGQTDYEPIAISADPGHASLVYSGGGTKTITSADSIGTVDSANGVNFLGSGWPRSLTVGSAADEDRYFLRSDSLGNLNLRRRWAGTASNHAEYEDSSSPADVSLEEGAIVCDDTNEVIHVIFGDRDGTDRHIRYSLFDADAKTYSGQSTLKTLTVNASVLDAAFANSAETRIGYIYYDGAANAVKYDEKSLLAGATVALTGAAGTAAAGTVTVTVADVVVALSGVSATASAGVLTIINRDIITLAGAHSAYAVTGTVKTFTSHYIELTAPDGSSVPVIQASIRADATPKRVAVLQVPQGLRSTIQSTLSGTWTLDFALYDDAAARTAYPLCSGTATYYDYSLTITENTATQFLGTLHAQNNPIYIGGDGPRRTVRLPLTAETALIQPLDIISAGNGRFVITKITVTTTANRGYVTLTGDDFYG